METASPPWCHILGPRPEAEAPAMFDPLVGPWLLWLALSGGIGPRDAEARVGLALRAEARGEYALRDWHLAAALATEPSHPRARALLGQVADKSDWVRPEDIGRRAREDSATAAALAEYNARRARTPDTVGGHWRLAGWCEERGLKAEATAHYTAVTRLDPSHEAAWSRLGCVRYRGRWMTAEQVAAEREAARARARDDRLWRPRLALWRTWLGRDDRKGEAVERLDRVRDPGAAAPVWRVFAGGDRRDQAWAVRLLGRIDAPEATHGLARLSIGGASATIRDAAADRLTPRDPRAFVGLLINQLDAPIAYEAEPVVGPGEPGFLRFETPVAIVERSYDPPSLDLPSGPRSFYSDNPSAPRGFRRSVATLRAPLDEVAIENLKAAEASARQLEGDVAAIEARNAATRLRNARVRRVLFRATGRDLGADRETWNAWWTDQLGYTYTSPQVLPKPVVSESAPPAYIPRPPTPVVQPSLHSCFGAGTPVRTRDGPRPIEGLEVGDLVLTQDAAGGALSYQPIVAVFHNRPNATVRVDLGDEAVVATGIHRFWVAGRGWVMARDLRAGDRLRALGGVRRVRGVRADKVQPVYNLEVARNATFFVGGRGLLVHDNTLVAPTTHPFDAPP